MTAPIGQPHCLLQPYKCGICPLLEGSIERVNFQYSIARNDIMVGTVQLQAGIVKLYLGTVNVQLGTRCNGIGLYWAEKVAKLDTGISRCSKVRYNTVIGRP